MKIYTIKEVSNKADSSRSHLLSEVYGTFDEAIAAANKMADDTLENIGDIAFKAEPEHFSHTHGRLATEVYRVRLISKKSLSDTKEWMIYEHNLNK